MINSFNRYVDGILNVFSNYFEHVYGWYKNKDKLKNILFIHYEDMKTDFENVLMEIAMFIDPKLIDRFKNDKQFFK